MTLHDLLAEIGRAGLVAENACRDGAWRWLKSMFRDVDDDGDQDPITVTLQVGGRTVDVPLIAIASPKSLSMESLEVEFEAEVTLPTAVDGGEPAGLLKRGRKAKTEVVPPATISLDMRRGLIKRATRFKVKACFKMSEPAETVEALRDALTEQVREQLRG